MAREIVNVGTNQDDGTGDNLRDAFIKVNANFTEIYSELGGTSLSNLRFSGSTITTDATNTSIILDPQGVGKITLNGDTHIAGNINATAAMVLSGNLNVGGGTTLTSTLNVADATTLSSTLDVTGASTFTGNVTAVNLATTGNTDLGNATSDTITATGRFDSNIVPSANATYDLGASSLRWNNVYAVNANISGDITLGGNLVGGDANTDTITLNAELTSDITPDQDSAYNLGSTSKRWANVWADKHTGTAFHTAGIEISGTTIKTSTTNNDLNLTASGTGDVVIDSVKVSDLTASRLALVGTGGALQDDGDFTYVSSGTGGTLTAKYLSSEKITVDNLQLDGSTISTTAGSLVLAPLSGQGISASSERITNVNTPTHGSDAATKDYADSLVSSIAWTVSDDTSNIALIDNGEDLKIQGGDSIQAILSYGSAGHILTINNQDTIATVIGRDATAGRGSTLELSQLIIDENIKINSNTIGTTLSNSDLQLQANGTGKVHVRDAPLEVDGTLSVTGVSTFTGATTHTGGVKVPNDGFVGSVGQAEAIKIASDGDVTFKADVNANAVGSTLKANFLIVDDNIALNGNKLFTNLSNSDIDIDPSGTGIVNIRSNVLVRGKITLLDGDTSSNYAGFGNADDLKIFHNGTHSIVRETGVGSLYLQSDNNVILSKDTDTEIMVKGIADGAVELYHNNVKKFETSSAGATVTGSLTATSTVDADTFTTDGISITDNNITSSRSNDNIVLDPNGTGAVEVRSNLTVSGTISGTISGSIDADSATVSNLEVDNFKASAVVTEGEGIASNDNDTTLPTSAAVKDYVDTNTVSASSETTFTADVKFDTGVEEKFATLTGSTGVTAMDCANGHIFYLTGASGDVTANFTNLGLTAEYATNLTVIINQGGTPYEVTAVQIGGAGQTIEWQGGSAPTGNANGIDSFSFTILNDGGTYVVLGQMVDFT